MAYRVYKRTQTHLDYDGYAVKVDGKPVCLDVARVSAMPFNRRWPGHQRQIEQSELVNFLSLETDGPVQFEITPRVPFEKVEIRPRSLIVQPEVVDGKIIFTLPHPAYFTVEPYGRHNALHVFADPVAEYEINPSNEDVIYFGEGEHDVGLIELKSGQTLFLDEGAVVYACIKAMDASDIRILGRGILDNSRNKEQILYEVNAENNTMAVNNAVRRHTIELEYCSNITIEGITIRDSLVYNIRPVACNNLSISNVKIIGCWRYNSDGIDMHNCVDVLIDNCFIRTFDDSICVKGFDCYYEGDVEAAVKAAMYRDGKAYDVFKHTLVKNCVIWNDWGRCLEIGAETRAEEICDIVFENCDVIHVVHDVLDCKNVDYADVHDLTYRNIRVELDEIVPQPCYQRGDEASYQQIDPDYAPAIMSAYVIFHPEYSAGGLRRGRNRKILFENIHIYGRQVPKFCFAGYSDQADTSDITIRNVYYNSKPLTKDDAYILEQNEFCKKISIEFACD